MSNRHFPCDGCGKPAVCFHDHDGAPPSDPYGYLCNDCCGHSGEEGECYRIRDGRPMTELTDEEVKGEGL